MYIGLLTSLFGGAGPGWSEDATCSIISLSLSISSFLVNIFAIGMLVNKMTRPDPKIEISTKLVLKTRDGIPIIQFRYMSGHGNRLTNLKAFMFAYVPKKSLEGESYVAHRVLEVETGHKGGVIVVNGNHYLNEASPLFGEDFSNFKGFIEVIMEGFDMFLGCVVKESRHYSHRDLYVGYDFADAYIVDPLDVVLKSAKGTINVDLKRMSEVKEMDAKWKAVLFETLKTNRQHVESRSAVHKDNLLQKHRSYGAIA